MGIAMILAFASVTREACAVIRRRIAINTRVAATPASLGIRLLAGLYDLLPLLGVWFLAGVLALAVTGGALDWHQVGHKLLVQGFELALGGGYFVISWLRGGQTLGMRAWHLRVVNADGGPLSPTQALLRVTVAFVSIAALGLGFVWALFDPRGRTWHDLAAATRVVRLAPKS